MNGFVGCSSSDHTVVNSRKKCFSTPAVVDVLAQVLRKDAAAL